MRGVPVFISRAKRHGRLTTRKQGTWVSAVTGAKSHSESKGRVLYRLALAACVDEPETRSCCPSAVPDSRPSVPRPIRSTTTCRGPTTYALLLTAIGAGPVLAAVALPRLPGVAARDRVLDNGECHIGAGAHDCVAKLFVRQPPQVVIEGQGVQEGGPGDVGPVSGQALEGRGVELLCQRRGLVNGSDFGLDRRHVDVLLEAGKQRQADGLEAQVDVKRVTRFELSHPAVVRR